MEQMETVHVQTHAKDEENIVEQEQVHVVMHQQDITQQDVIVQEINVQDKRPVVVENIVRQEQEYVMPSVPDVMDQVLEARVQTHAKDKENIVEQDHQVVVQPQQDITQQDVTVQVINVQDKLPVELVSIVQQEQENVMPSVPDVMDQVREARVQTNALLEHLVQQVQSHVQTVQVVVQVQQEQ